MRIVIVARCAAVELQESVVTKAVATGSSVEGSSNSLRAAALRRRRREAEISSDACNRGEVSRCLRRVSAQTGGSPGTSLGESLAGVHHAIMSTERQSCTSGGEPITRPVLLLELLSRLVGGIVGWLWLDGETQRADLTAADFLVRGSVAVGVFAVLLWLIFR